jgi:phosphoribosylformimino-5-aminoimidazole carboxamide ribotide isomerase
VALAFRDQLGLNELYLADLDAIGGAPPNLHLYASLRELGFRLWVDSGIREPFMVDPLVAADVSRIVIGLETIRGPMQLEEICRAQGKEIVAFSLDLNQGIPLGNMSGWVQADAYSVAGQAIEFGIESLIVLDLARVGSGGGTGTEALCRKLISAFPRVQLVTGGGIQDVADIHRLKGFGVYGVLVASAIHDERLRRADLAGL